MHGYHLYTLEDDQHPVSKLVGILFSMLEFDATL